MRLIKTIELTLHHNRSTGISGILHKNATDDDLGFDPFWNGIGIFHDVFEHNHEETHPYFRGDYAFNLGGEMAAMGAMWYYYSELGIHKRLDYTSVPPGDAMRNTTESEIKEITHTGYYKYGQELLCNVPYQKPVDSSELEYQIKKEWRNIKTKELHVTRAEEVGFVENYLKSISFGKIANLHRYGYRMAERFIPNTSHNHYLLNDFIRGFDKFTTQVEAESLINRGFEDVTFKIYRDKYDIRWNVTFHHIDEEASVKISSDDLENLTNKFII